MRPFAMKLTLDTNVLWDAADPTRGEHHHVALKLLDLRDSGACEVYRTTRLDVDVEHGDIRERILALPQVADRPIASAFRIGFSALGADILVNDGWVERERGIRQLVFPGLPEQGRKERSRKADLDHLMAHDHSGNDWFVTRDAAILDAGDALAESFGITVMGPEKAMKALAG